MPSTMSHFFQTLKMKRMQNHLGQQKFKDLEDAIESHDPFASQALRSMSYMSSGAADLGEVLLTMSALAENVPFNEQRERWYKVWRKLAEHVNTQGVSSQDKGHLCSAASSYLRAVEYYRQSAFFIRDNLDDSRVAESARHMQTAFRAYSACTGLDAEPIQIPFDGNHMLGYFIPAVGLQGKQATMICYGSTDNHAEEAWYSTGKFAHERGYNVLLVDLPGCGSTLVLNRLVFTPDSEKTLDAVGMYLETRPEVDMQQLVIFGRSYGSFLSPRIVAASTVPIAALMLDPMQVGYHGMKRMVLPPKALAPFAKGDDATVDKLLEKEFKKLPFVKFHVMSRATGHGLKSPSRFLHRALNEFACEHLLPQIKCPVWTTDNEPVKPGKIIDDARLQIKDITIQRFGHEDGAVGHIQAGATQRMMQCAFNWLDERLERVEKASSLMATPRSIAGHGYGGNSPASSITGGPSAPPSVVGGGQHQIAHHSYQSTPLYLEEGQNNANSGASDGRMPASTGREPPRGEQRFQESDEIEA